MRVAVIGAGVVGLCTAWHLARAGAEVTVLDRTREDRDRASWGNAGHVVPAMSMPLPEARNLAAAASSVVRRNAAVTAPRSLDAGTARFLAGFSRNARRGRWESAMRELAPLNGIALPAFEEMEVAGVETTRRAAPFTSALSHPRRARPLLDHYAAVAAAGADIDLRLLSGAALHRAEPLARDQRFGVELAGQSLVNPPGLLRGLRRAVESLGGAFDLASDVRSVDRGDGGVLVRTRDGRLRFDAAVIATGAGLSRLAAPHGVRVPVAAGYGYSLSVEVPEQTRGMLYFPSELVASTRYGERLRVSSLMQIDRPDAEGRRASHDRLLRAARAVLPRADWATASDRWFGARPLTADGKPLLGPTATPGVHVNGGHGMWGITLGPASGKLVAAAVLDGPQRSVLRGFETTR